MILRSKFSPKSEPDYSRYSDIPGVLEGQLEYDTLCPVSKFTGHHTNPLDVLGMQLGSDKARLVQSILQELPVSNEPSSDGNFEYLVSRLDSGNTPAEREQLVRDLYAVADSLEALQPALKQQIDSAKDNISFDKADAPAVES